MPRLPPSARKRMFRDEITLAGQCAGNASAYYRGTASMGPSAPVKIVTLIRSGGSEATQPVGDFCAEVAGLQDESGTWFYGNRRDWSSRRRYRCAASGMPALQKRSGKLPRWPGLRPELAPGQLSTRPGGPIFHPSTQPDRPRRRCITRQADTIITQPTGRPTASGWRPRVFVFWIASQSPTLGTSPSRCSSRRDI